MIKNTEIIEELGLPENIQNTLKDYCYANQNNLQRTFEFKKKHNNS